MTNNKEIAKVSASSLKDKMGDPMADPGVKPITMENTVQVEANNSPILSGESDVSLDQNNIAVTTEAEKSKAVAEIQASLVMAHKFPRNESQAFAKLARSLDRVNFSKNCLYAFPRGGRTIEGPGIVLAREAARCWGNLRYGMTIIHETDDDRTIEGWAWDLETNVRTASQATFRKLIQRKNKYKGTSEWVKPDERDMRELTNKHASLCTRNAILQLMPQDIIDDCVQKAKIVARKGVDGKNMKKERAGVINLFEQYGISVENLEENIGAKSDTWQPQDIATLMNLANGLKDESITRDDILKKDSKESK